MTVFNSSPSGGNLTDRWELLLNAIASFEQAIAIDPGNDDAKYNLQAILLRGQGLLPTEASAGRNPAPGGRGSRGAGAGSRAAATRPVVESRCSPRSASCSRSASSCPSSR